MDQWPRRDSKAPELEFKNVGTDTVSLAEFREELADTPLEQRRATTTEMLSAMNTAVAFFMAYPPELRAELRAVLEVGRQSKDSLPDDLKLAKTATIELVRQLIDEEVP